jgi:hypothetical protein
MSKVLLTIITSTANKRDPRALEVKASALVGSKYRVEGTLDKGLILTTSVKGNAVKRGLTKENASVRFQIPDGGPNGLAWAEAIARIENDGRIVIQPIPLGSWTPRAKVIRRRRPRTLYSDATAKPSFAPAPAPAPAPQLPGLEERPKPNGADVGVNEARAAIALLNRAQDNGLLALSQDAKGHLTAIIEI